MRYGFLLIARSIRLFVLLAQRVAGWDKGWRPTEYDQGHHQKEAGYVVAQYRVVPNLYQTAPRLPTLRIPCRLAFPRISSSLGFAPSLKGAAVALSRGPLDADNTSGLTALFPRNGPLKLKQKSFIEFLFVGSLNG